MDQIQAEQIANGQLDSGERLLWSGSPAPAGIALSTVPVSIFGVVFAGFAAFWMWGAASATSHVAPGGWMLFPLFGLPFLLIGLAMITTPLWAYAGAGKTVYAVTDKRALIICGTGSRGVQSYTSADIGEISRVERADGFGTVYFANRSFGTSQGMQSVNRSVRVGFVGIPDVRRVEQLIRDNLHNKAA